MVIMRTDVRMAPECVEAVRGRLSHEVDTRVMNDHLIGNLERFD